MLIDELQGLVTFGASRDASITRTKVGAYRSLRASSPFGGYHEKWTRERHARRDAKASGGGGGGGGGQGRVYKLPLTKHPSPAPHQVFGLSGSTCTVS